MKKQLLVLAVIVAMLVPMTAMAVDVTWGGDMSVEASRTMIDGENADVIDQSLSLNAKFDLGQGVSLFTEFELFDGVWSGDDNPGYNLSESDEGNFLLRQAYLSVPLAGGTLNVGRQEANWAHGLTTHEDLRDRVSYVNTLGNYLGGPLTVLALYDMRDEGNAETLDRNMFGAAVIGYHLEQQLLWGLLAAYFAGDDYALDSNVLIGPIAETKVGPVDLKFGAHTIMALDDEKSILFNETNFAIFLRTAVDLADLDITEPGQVVIESQVMFNYQDALISGWDTWSSNLGTIGVGSEGSGFTDGIGGLGLYDVNILVFGLRANVEVMPGLNVVPAFGGITAMIDDAVYELVVGTDGYTQLFFDLGATYEITQQASIYADLGFLLGNEDSPWTVADENEIRLGLGVEVSF